MPCDADRRRDPTPIHSNLRTFDIPPIIPVRFARSASIAITNLTAV
jgi:hypothetical protein